MRLHWESWLLRAALLATAVYQLSGGNTGKEGAIVAVEGFIASLIPLLVERLSRTRMPRALEFGFVLGMTLQFISESTKLFELLYYWDKLVHPTLIALTGMIAAWLLLGYRDTFHKRIPIHLVAAFGMLLGLSVGAFWEFVEFTADWFGNTDLQKSNADTISDIMSNNIGAFVATELALWLYTHRFGPRQRRELGIIARWLTHGPTLLARRHGRIIGTAAAVLFAVVVFLANWVDRDVPALASGLAPGTSKKWHFVDEGMPADALVLGGDWLPDPRGVCRQNLENPKPGSEKMGLLRLASSDGYGLNGQQFSIEARYFEERPAVSQGSEMNAGIAIGIRDAEDFDLLEQSALHDLLRLDHFIHGKRRDLREKLFRTHGNEWHMLRVSVAGASVTASVDGWEISSVSNAPDTDGGIGLWARSAAATCFSDVTVEVQQ